MWIVEKSIRRGRHERCKPRGYQIQSLNQTGVISFSHIKLDKSIAKASRIMDACEEARLVQDKPH